MPRVTFMNVLAGNRLHVEFTDGVGGEIDLTDRLFGPMFEPLQDRKLFEQAFVDEFGAVCWPNRADLAPDALHESLRSQSVDA